MKDLTFCFFALICSVVVGAENPTFRFESKIGMPALSLLESAKQTSLPVLNDVSAYFRSVSPQPKAAPKIVSRMPVITPDSAIDYKLRVATPDESVDHKIIVKTPEVGASR